MKTLVGNRMETLLRKSAKCFELGTTPFSDEFLSENKVTFDEAHALSNSIAVAVAGFLVAPKEVQAYLLVHGNRLLEQEPHP